MLDENFDLVKRDELPEWPGLSEAVCEVLRAGRKDGREHMIALDPDGRELFMVTGDRVSVGIPMPWNLPGMLQGTLLVHNHPVGVGLSVSDLAVAQSHGTGIVAVMPDGSWDYVGKVETHDLEDAQAMTEAIRKSERLVQILSGKTLSVESVVGPGNLLPVVAGYNLGIVRDWKHSYSDEFWAKVEKYVPNIKRGSFVLKGGL